MESKNANWQNPPNNKLGIIISYNEKRSFVLIDAAISGYRNLMKKDAEMILEYKDFTIELMWNLKQNWYQ